MKREFCLLASVLALISAVPAETLQEAAVRYTVTWVIDTITTSSRYTDGAVCVPPAVADACDGRIGVGWTTDASFADGDLAPEEFFTNDNLPPVSADITYYAVYALRAHYERVNTLDAGETYIFTASDQANASTYAIPFATQPVGGSQYINGEAVTVSQNRTIDQLMPSCEVYCDGTSIFVVRGGLKCYVVAALNRTGLQAANPTLPNYCVEYDASYGLYADSVLKKNNNIHSAKSYYYSYESGNRRFVTNSMNKKGNNVSNRVYAFRRVSSASGEEFSCYTLHPCPEDLVNPLIFTANDNLDRFRGDFSNIDIIVRTGVTLTLNNSIRIHSLTLEGGWNSSRSAYSVPRLNVARGVVITADEAWYDLRIDKTQYYPLALPCSVAVSTVDYKNATYAAASVYGTHYLIKRYDGTLRNANGTGNRNWENVGFGETLIPGEGYTIVAVPAGGETTAVIRFPLALTPAINTIPVTAFGLGEVATEDVGWNYIGMPFMAGGMTLNESLKGSMDHLYVNVPTTDFGGYWQTDVTDQPELLPFTGFFVQVGETGNLTCTPINGQMPEYAPSRNIAVEPEQRLTLTLAHADETDRTTFYIRDSYTTDYEIGADLVKLFGASKASVVYSLSGGKRLCYNALPQSATTSLPIGFRASEAGEYTLSIADIDDAVEAAWLSDSETGLCWNLKQSPYTFSAAQTQDDSRFVLRLNYVGSSTPTTIFTTSDQQQADKLLLQSRICIVRGNKIYSVLGECLR